ncbi:hypothetical protein [Hyphomonas sp.]|uniref:hypothetical protein n=1 Tax=Hyphomonas sp. TaxID=87 RepID=UPI0025C70A62|nr:hypothetical protein [Hyphomonas sp.]
MRRIGIALVSLVLAACAAGEALTEGAKPALDLSEKGKTSGDGDNTGFSRSVAARYAGGLPAAEIMQDLVSQGFSCDEANAYCTRAVMDGVCADAWNVDFSDSGEASGTLVRRCMGAEVDEE